MRYGSLVLALLLANTISAATQFQFVVESTGDRVIPRRAGTIRIDGGAYRVDYEKAENPLATASFSIDGGKTVTMLNEQRSTYYRPKAHPSELPSSALYSVPVVLTPKAVVKVKDVVLEEQPSEERIAGHSTKKYLLRFTHDVRMRVDGHPVRVIYRSTVSLWTTEDLDLPGVPMNLRELRTELSTVDQAVNAALSGVKGFPLKRHLEVMRKFEGGMEMNAAVTTTFDDFKTAALPPAALAVPAGYRYEAPVILTPGALSRN
jgi:hypothetical protein